MLLAWTRQRPVIEVNFDDDAGAYQVARGSLILKSCHEYSPGKDAARLERQLMRVLLSIYQ